ncbi:MAG TPA: hypothetical protein VE891_12440 [Allosphingosinicella sp.]|nr:hypothetical protein [Allosphingosinicella sp.]
MTVKSLYCNRCRFRLSAPLTLVSGKDPAVEAPHVRVGKALIERGIAYKSWKLMPWFYISKGHPLDFVPQMWMNPDDLEDRVSDTPNSNLLGGCSGPTGMDGPNKVCECKAHVGTLQADCSTPIVFISDPATTIWREGSADFWDYP